MTQYNLLYTYTLQSKHPTLLSNNFHFLIQSYRSHYHSHHTTTYHYHSSNYSTSNPITSLQLPYITFFPFLFTSTNSSLFSYFKSQPYLYPLTTFSPQLFQTFQLPTLTTQHPTYHVFTPHPHALPQYLIYNPSF